MNAHGRRVVMRSYERRSGLGAMPFGILRLVVAGEWQSAEELRLALGLPEPSGWPFEHLRHGSEPALKLYSYV